MKPTIGIRLTNRVRLTPDDDEDRVAKNRHELRYNKLSGCSPFWGDMSCSHIFSPPWRGA
jgi:hypothetical protein